jgi:DNA-binding response OmpR family regulator
MNERKIVIADDEAFLTQVLSYNLEKCGFKVFVANNGEELCAMAEAQRPDLILTDYQMPILDGLAACTRLKKNPVTCDIPVLMLTARGHRLGTAELDQTNIRMLLPKPFSLRDLIARIQDLLSTASVGPEEPVR